MRAGAEPFLVIARLVAPYGVRGEIKADIVTDFPARFGRTRRVYLGPALKPCEVSSTRLVGAQVVFKFRGVESRNQARQFRGLEVLVPIEEGEPLPAGEFYWHQVVGLAVKDSSDRWLGDVNEVLATGSNDVYVVRGPAGEWLLPSTREVVRAIDPENGVITVELLPGMGPSS